jgi:hypothetical protein
MPSTFADQLKLFALSVDVIGIDRFNRVTRLIDDYCRETLGILFTKIHVASEVNRQQGLKQYGMGVSDIEDVRTIRDNDGRYNGQVSLSFDKCKPLWIVSASGKQTLANCDQFSDQWSRLRNIPAYQATGDLEENGIRTAIFVPIRDRNEVLGIMSFGIPDYIEITEEAKSELTKIADTLGILVRLFRAADAQKTSTETALENLQQLLNRPLPKLTKPKIFLASSEAAESDVIDVVLGVLKEDAYAERLDLVYWKDMEHPGNINRQLLEAIASARYGICYFSQKVDDGEYIDNINVAFEAGMFHGRVDEITPVPASWIPIRELRSPDLPFDFAQERILWVERTKAGSLRAKSFAVALRRGLDALLSIA